MRKAGVLMPVASLPSDYGIGDFGPKSYQFAELIHRCGFSIWQILPLNPLGFGNSPYQPYSSHAMDELYISLDLLAEEGMIDPAEKFHEDENRIEYDEVRAYKQYYLREAYKQFRGCREFDRFCKEDWVYPYAVFLTLKKAHHLMCWNEWDRPSREWIRDGRLDLTPYADDIRYEMFIQYVLRKQWLQLRKHCNRLGIRIMGDVPFYVGLDSDDTWCHQEQFLLDRDGRPEFVAGVPPDNFSATGQRWGNPIYDWKAMRKDGFRLWTERLAYSATLYDLVRIDHFRAFDTYWKIPASCPTAMEGQWIEAPGYEFFDQLYAKHPQIRIVAEDLGDLRSEVHDLRDHYHLTGMKIVQEALGNLDFSASRRNIIVYTGTHDNQTIRSWYQQLPAAKKKKIRIFLAEKGCRSRSISRNMVQYTLNSRADYAVIPLFDLLNKDDRCRINTPGTVGSPNWEWRLVSCRDLKKRTEEIRGLIRESGRLPR
jgi:4-alpha-glucanotransferase